MNMGGKIFLISRKDRQKEVKTEFFVRCRRTYVLNDIPDIILWRLFKPIILINI